MGPSHKSAPTREEVQVSPKLSRGRSRRTDEAFSVEEVRAKILPKEGIPEMDEEVTITLELTVGQRLKVTVTGSNPQSVVRAAKEVLDTIYVELVPPQEQQRQQGIPPSVIEKLPKMSNKEIVLTLLYFEGEMSKETINQRSRELGKEVSKEWLDKKLYTEMEGLISSVESTEGPKLYRLTVYGRQKAEEVLRSLGIALP
jgi:hypothetical protein